MMMGLTVFYILLFMVLMAGIGAGLIYSEISGVCRFAENCELYNPDSKVCNKWAGQYYGPGRYAGCYRKKLEQKKQKTKGDK